MPDLGGQGSCSVVLSQGSNLAHPDRCEKDNIVDVPLGEGEGVSQLHKIGELGDSTFFNPEAHSVDGVVDAPMLLGQDGTNLQIDSKGSDGTEMQIDDQEMTAPMDMGETDTDVWVNAEYLDSNIFQPETQFEVLFQYDPEGAVQLEQEVGMNNTEGEVGSNEGRAKQHSKIALGFKKDAKKDADVELAEQVMQTGQFNFCGARIPIETSWNTQLLGDLLEGYHDKEVVEMLKFGWPIDRDPTCPLPPITGKNHKGALDFAQQVDEHIAKEVKLNAIAGPFDEVPFADFVCSLLNSRAKKNSNKRRLLMDLSWEPNGPSVNAGIDKDRYLGKEVRLKYPTVFTFIKRIKELSVHGKPILMYKRDWARAFSQLGLDPAAYRLIGFLWRGKYYFSKVVPMGLGSACLACQITSSAVRYIMNRMGYYLCNYIDNIMSAELEEKAWRSFEALARLFRDLGVQESEEKAVAPTVEMEFVGNLLNTITMTISVTKERRAELLTELAEWWDKTTTTRRELESLVGKLQFVCNCIRSGRIFLNRLLNLLCGTRVGLRYHINEQAKKDILWWSQVLKVFSGTSLMWMERFDTPDAVLAANACTTGAGGTFKQREDDKPSEVYRAAFPEHIKDGASIAYLELWALIISLKIWGPRLAGKAIVVHCDNEAVANLVNTGRAKEIKMQQGLCEVCYLAAKFEFEILARFLPGIQNRIPDMLSRWGKGQKYRDAFRQEAGRATRKPVRNSLFYFSHEW